MTDEVAAILGIDAEPFESVVWRFTTIIAPSCGLTAYCFINLGNPRLENLVAARVTQRPAMVKVLMDEIGPAHFIFNIVFQFSMHT